jgi:hypothetical protein
LGSDRIVDHSGDAHQKPDCGGADEQDADEDLGEVCEQAGEQILDDVPPDVAGAEE